MSGNGLLRRGSGKDPWTRWRAAVIAFFSAIGGFILWANTFGDNSQKAFQVVQYVWPYRLARLVPGTEAYNFEEHVHNLVRYVNIRLETLEAYFGQPVEKSEQKTTTNFAGKPITPRAYTTYLFTPRFGTIYVQIKDNAVLGYVISLKEDAPSFLSTAAAKSNVPIGKISPDSLKNSSLKDRRSLVWPFKGDSLVGFDMGWMEDFPVTTMTYLVDGELKCSRADNKSIFPFFRDVSCNPGNAKGRLFAVSSMNYGYWDAHGLNSDNPPEVLRGEMYLMRDAMDFDGSFSIANQ